MPDRPRSSYRELPAPEALAPYVACLWEHAIGDGEVVYDQPVLPDGCIDLVVLDGEVILAGPATRPVRLELAPGSVLAGVGLPPGGARRARRGPRRLPPVGGGRGGEAPPATRRAGAIPGRPGRAERAPAPP